MKKTTKLTSYVVLILLLFTLMSQINTTTSNNGVPTRVLEGGYGHRINIIWDLFLGTDTMTFSTSDRTYVQHGVGGIIPSNKEGDGPQDWANIRVILEVDDEVVKMRRFAYHNPDGTLDYLHYAIFDAFHFSVGEHSWEVTWIVHGEVVINLSHIITVLP